MIYGVRLAGSLTLDWIDVDRSFAPGDLLRVNCSSARIIVTGPQLNQSVSNVMATAAQGAAVASPAIDSSSESTATLDTLLEAFPAPGSAWTSNGETGMVVSIDFKRLTIGVRTDESSEVRTIPFVPITREE